MIMPEEVVTDAASDVTDAVGADTKGEEAGEGEFADLKEKPVAKTPEEQLKELQERTEEEKKTWLEKQKQLERGLSAERSKRKRLEREVEEAKKDDEESEEKQHKPADIEKVVSEQFQKKELEKYNTAVVAEIKSRSKYREEAELLKHYVDTLPEKTGDAAKDVRRALAWMNTVKGEEDQAVSMSPTSSGAAWDEPKTHGVPKSAIAFGREVGHTEEDFKKYYKDELTF